MLRVDALLSRSSSIYIRFRNITDKPIFTSLGDISIAFPMEDMYDSSQVCMRLRCHTHIFCGGEVS
ncbi:hypothetical protein [uncultured Acetatifactor sp.]|uniref:hypothetical protein n=1 Tax=uncultured Acetatifactor sp. TaxID=1671927 RepID=UPI00272CE47A|nr:hypothetical protein [uncultured Acetatifactor sp.]